MDKHKLLKRKSKAAKEKNEDLLISICTDLANLYVEENQFNNAVNEYSFIADIYKKRNKRLEFALANRAIGEAYLGLHDFEQALHYQNIYLDIARELNNRIEEQRALATIGHAYLTSYLDNPADSDRTNRNLAYKFFRESMKVCESLIGEISNMEAGDMLARLFSNLGLVQDSLGNSESAQELIKKSINICKAHDIYEQLYRGYISLASVLEKSNDSTSALRHYSLAVETAKRFHDKPSLLSSALLSKADILVKLGDFLGARQALLKAYKLKITDVQERNIIEQNLRIVAFMCCTENKLLQTQDTEYEELKSLYEKLGDAACELKHYTKAIDYYKQMLEAVQKSGADPSQLAPCYYSLGETLKDSGQFEEAVAYFEQELDLCAGPLRDSLNTLCKIANTKEAAKCSTAEVKAVYDRAADMCREKGDIHEEGRMLSHCIAYLRRQKKDQEALELEEERNNLNYVSSGSESDNSGDLGNSKIGNDIDLDEITDESDDGSPSKQLSSPTRNKRRCKTFKLQKNMRGETQLHVACIKNKVSVVKHLLEQGHPVNVRDNCGWLPLHEACNYGHLEIVRLLLNKGATVNDRGGTDCDGTTPLHDAALNGHLEIVELLLNSGANPLAKMDGGDTVLDCLKRGRPVNATEDWATQQLYEKIFNEVSLSLEKAGQAKTKQPEVLPCNMMTPTTSNRALRRSKSIGLEDFSLNDSTTSDHTDDYRHVMNSLRHKNTNTAIPATPTKRPALIDETSQVEDWLDDDMPARSSKKRKTISPAKKKSKSPTKKSPASRLPLRRSSLISPEENSNSAQSDEVLEAIITNDIDNHDVEDSAIECNDFPYQSTSLWIRHSSSGTIRKRKRQAKLTNFGHTRSFVEADSTSSQARNLVTLISPPRKAEVAKQTWVEPTLSVDVRINDKLYRVPVLLAQVNTRTIKWLAEEAATRYAKKEYIKPVLELETKNGALLADDDLLSILFPLGASQSEPVEARIVRWNIPHVTQRFREACQDMNIEPHDIISQMLQEMSVSLDLSSRGFSPTNLLPLCKAINRQETLLHLDLSGNFLSTDCVQLLKTSLPSLHNIERLNLSCTGLNSEHLQILASNLPTDDKILPKLIDLDVSDNRLGNRGFTHLTNLVRDSKLKGLNIALNDLTGNLQTLWPSDGTHLDLSQVENLDLSNNSLTNQCIDKFLQLLNATTVKTLNLSRNAVTEGLSKYLTCIPSSTSGDNVTLKSLKLSRCQLQDSDVFDLLEHLQAVDDLDLSYNSALTGISLRRLLQHRTLSDLKLYGCNNIFKYFPTSHYDDLRQSCKTIKLNLNVTEHEREHAFLKELWEKWYGDSVLVEETANFLSLSVL